jgi:DNA polymerase III psi subunit
MELTPELVSLIYGQYWYNIAEKTQLQPAQWIRTEKAIISVVVLADEYHQEDLQQLLHNIIKSIGLELTQVSVALVAEYPVNELFWDEVYTTHTIIMGSEPAKAAPEKVVLAEKAKTAWVLPSLKAMQADRNQKKAAWELLKILKPELQL